MSAASPPSSGSTKARPFDPAAAYADHVRYGADDHHARPASPCDVGWCVALRSGYRAAGRLLLECRRFSTDMLFIAADAFDEIERERRLLGFAAEADEARALADALRTEAPRRLRHSCAGPDPALFGAALLDRAVLVQAYAAAQRAPVSSADALRIAYDQILDRPLHVAGGAA